MVTAIIVCEVGFWVVLGAGLLARYGLRRPQLGGALLVGVPLVDVALLALTVLDLRSGTPPQVTHGLAAIYLGFSVAFGPGLVRWADVRVAHRFAGGPAPKPRPPAGSAARARQEWTAFARACLGAAISAALLGLAILLVGSSADTAPLVGWYRSLAIVLGIWLVTGPLWELGRTRPHDRSAHPSA